ncbi:MAG: stage 0 sporulation family protein [Clostridiales bacterium]|jgi:cell fate regulator YaaT (PSP1 superfamily)|nr:stage 0 sporulation family protein [Clostridiales bacterium]
MKGNKKNPPKKQDKKVNQPIHIEEKKPAVETTNLEYLEFLEASKQAFLNSGDGETTEIIGVRFKQAGRIYYFDPEEQQFECGQGVIVETSRGIELGNVEESNRIVPTTEIIQPLRKIIRPASEEDYLKREMNKQFEHDALEICEERIANHGLKMKLVDVEVTFDMTKIVFYFTADGRIDFRELVKELAATFRMRIELRQIGVRDEAKLLNGVGICGRSLCCSNFLEDFQPVSIKMAKEQNLSLNPTKISGVCGRLMCCLKYEESVYEFLNRGMPSEGDIVRTPDGDGEVLSTSVLRQLVKVAVRTNKNSGELNIGMYASKELKILKRNVPDDKESAENGRLKNLE